MPKKFNRAEIERIRDSHRIEDVVARYTELKPAGRNRLKGLCPFHQDNDASFFVYTDSQSWYCFGCHAGRDMRGSHDVFKFLMIADNLSFPGVVERLSVGVPEGNTPINRPKPKPAPERVLTDAELHLLTTAADVFHTQLMTHQPALDYLTGRGYDMDTIRARKLGYASGNRLRKYLRFKGWDEEIAAGLNLLEEAGGREFFRNRIIIPEWRNDKAIYLAGRALGSFNPKYLFMNDVPKPMYGLELARGKDEVFVTEGVFDWLTLLAWGYPAVCLLGTWLKKSHAEFLSGFERVYAAFDNDRAGGEAADRLREALGERVLPLSLPDGIKDIGELGEHPGGRRRFEGRLMAL